MRSSIDTDTGTWEDFPFLPTLAALIAILVALGIAWTLTDVSAGKRQDLLPAGSPPLVHLAPARDLTSETPGTAIFIVASNSEKATVEKAVRGVPMTFADYHILVVNTLEEQFALNSLNQELFQASTGGFAPGVTIIDLR